MAEIFELRNGYLFEMHRREEGGFKDICSSAQNAALFVDLLWNIFSLELDDSAIRSHKIGQLVGSYHDSTSLNLIYDKKKI